MEGATKEAMAEAARGGICGRHKQLILLKLKDDEKQSQGQKGNDENKAEGNPFSSSTSSSSATEDCAPSKRQKNNPLAQSDTGQGILAAPLHQERATRARYLN